MGFGVLPGKASEILKTAACDTVLGIYPREEEREKAQIRERGRERKSIGQISINRHPHSESL